MAVSKDTVIYLWAAEGKGNIKYCFKPLTKSTNKSKATAKALTVEKAERFGWSPACNFDRWFKVKLTSNQIVKLTNFTSGYHKVVCVSSSGDIIPLNCKGKYYGDERYLYTFTTKKTMKKGTYYFKIKHVDGSRKFDFFTIKWKK